MSEQKQMDYDRHRELHINSMNELLSRETNMKLRCCVWDCRSEWNASHLQKNYLENIKLQGYIGGGHLCCLNCKDEFDLMDKCKERYGDDYEWRPIDGKENSFKEGVYTYYKYMSKYQGNSLNAEYEEEQKKYRLEITKQTQCFVEYNIVEIESWNGNYGVRPLDHKNYSYKKKKKSVGYKKYTIDIPHLKSGESRRYMHYNSKHTLDIGHLHPFV